MGRLMLFLIFVVDVVWLFQGEEISIHYAGGLKGRLFRRRLMREGWFFDCYCDRYISGDEMGSHMSTLICNICTGKKGLGTQLRNINYYNLFHGHVLTLNKFLPYFGYNSWRHLLSI